MQEPDHPLTFGRMRITFEQVRSFVTVASTSSFTQAAEVLHLSQPALTTRIRQLEDALELRLFDRNTRSVELSDEGRMLLLDQIALRARQIGLQLQPLVLRQQQIEPPPGLSGLTPLAGRAACAAGATAGIGGVGMEAQGQHSEIPKARGVPNSRRPDHRDVRVCTAQIGLWTCQRAVGGTRS